MTQNLINHGPKIALFEPDIPQNTAAIIRTCACLGAKLEIIEPCGFMLNDRRFKRVVMDYMNEKDIKFHQSSDDFFKSKKDQRIVLMTTKASVSYTKFKFNKNDTILFGRESAGVPKYVHESVDDAVTIEMPGKGRSLNVVVSCVMVLSEAIRQTRDL